MRTAILISVGFLISLACFGFFMFKLGEPPNHPYEIQGAAYSLAVVLAILLHKIPD